MILLGRRAIEGAGEQEIDEYVYEPLPGPRWIRVMVLEPAQTLEDPLVARLEMQHLGLPLPHRFAEPVYDLWAEDPDYDGKSSAWKVQQATYVALIRSSRLPYNAFSYSWALENGDESLSCVLMLDNARLPITQNLSDGLRRKRAKTTVPQRLWVDAVCIDQRKVAEKSAQVMMMADIFRLAQQCTVWLGEGISEE